MRLLSLVIILIMRMGVAFHMSRISSRSPRSSCFLYRTPSTESEKAVYSLSINACRLRPRYILALAAKKKKANGKRASSFVEDDDNDFDSKAADIGVEIGENVEVDDGDAIDDIPVHERDRSMDLPGEKKREIVDNIIRTVVQDNNAILRKDIKWISGRIEITVSNSEDGNASTHSATFLEKIHRQLYSELELREEELHIVTNYEILVATPGVSDNIQTDQEYASFKGFPVIVSTTEEYKNKMTHEGTLVKREEESVSISVKGRLVKIPLEIVDSVRLKKMKYEAHDQEMSKLKD